MLSSSSKHAITALLFLSDYSDSEFCSVSVLAQQTALPQAYLSKIIHTLANKALLNTKKGAKGGVALKTKATSFYNICEALGDPIVRENCFLSSSACDQKKPCPFHKSWSAERRRLISFLKENKIQKNC